MMFKGLLRVCACSLFLAAGGVAPVLAEMAGDDGFQPQARALVEARHALERGEWDKAVEMFGALVNSGNLPPRVLAHALLNRGLAHQRLGRHEEAARDYDAALRIDALDTTTRVRALYNRALAWRSLGRHGQAMEDLTAALYLAPDFAQAWHARGNILHERGLYYLALSDYDQALAREHPQPHRVHYARALLFSALNSLPRTKEALYAALREKPDFKPARERLASILKGRVRANHLFADLARPPARKRIVARIGVRERRVGGETRLASVHVVAPATLNLRKHPQARPVAPPEAEADVIADAKRGNGDDAVRAAPRAGDAVRAGTMKGENAETATETATETTAETAMIDAAAVRVATPRRLGEGKAGKADGKKDGKKGGKVRTATITPVSAESTEHAEVPLKQPRWRGWAVQIASQRSEEAARAHWKKLERKVRRRVRQGEPVVMRAELGARGTFYRLRLVGFKDRGTARRACRALKRGRISCLVVPANG